MLLLAVRFNVFEIIKIDFFILICYNFEYQRLSLRSFTQTGAAYELNHTSVGNVNIPIFEIVVCLQPTVIASRAPHLLREQSWTCVARQLKLIISRIGTDIFSTLNREYLCRVRAQILSHVATKIWGVLPSASQTLIRSERFKIA